MSLSGFPSADTPEHSSCTGAFGFRHTSTLDLPALLTYLGTYVTYSMLARVPTSPAPGYLPIYLLTCRGQVLVGWLEIRTRHGQTCAIQDLAKAH